MGHRGPIRVPSAPACDENSSIRIVTGIVASPASSGEKPDDVLQLLHQQEPRAASAP